jgi:hypothetical protein
MEKDHPKAVVITPSSEREFRIGDRPPVSREAVSPQRRRRAQIMGNLEYTQIYRVGEKLPGD